MLELTINGDTYEVDASVGQTLAETLRGDLGLTGTKVACGEGHCGACTVQLDGVPTLSCITLVCAGYLFGQAAVMRPVGSHSLEPCRAQLYRRAAPHCLPD